MHGLASIGRIIEASVGAYVLGGPSGDMVDRYPHEFSADRGKDLHCQIFGAQSS